MAVHEPPQRKRRLSRRFFTRAMGASALAAATSVATQARPASAQAICEYLCCQLLYCPTFPYSTCSNNATYIWGCYSGASFCRCCEAPGRASISCYP
ncbi:hypothetical protein HD597_003666 [Nonomuraea thailandensis]|uniref:Twin-arginine translocation signal domain-containing protein n=1 Tax=Nonomuraea thailandensis TaxID=1188745 RepID=A0A9X2GD03_9ACTN|nr:hypothetical protein [Nonomuraea thailandensis]MCP2356646.1 hypothetical protein [Nonomuraea thailandensis]